MGNQSSGHSNRGTTGDLSTLRSDWPLRFHDIHGDNIELLENKTQAKRSDSFCKGICFSNRPIAINEKVYIRFIDTSGSWSGVLRFGFTNIDPGTQRGSELPRYACPDMTNKPGHWAKALGERYAVVNNLLYFYVTRSGDVLYGVNGDDKGLFFSGVNTNGPIWALLDIYGNTTCVEFARVETQQLNNMTSHAGQSVSMQQDTVTSMSSMTISGNERSVPTSLPLIRYHVNVNFTPLPFNNLCGKNVRLSHDRTVAYRVQEEYCNAYVFTSRPLRCGEKMVIQVQGVDKSFVGGMAFGFTACDPSTVKTEELPDDSDLLLDRMEYWVVNKDVCRSPDIGDELSFYLTSEGELRYSKNNHKVSTLMHVDRTLPLWAFFDVYGNVQKIKMLGTTIPQPPRPFPRSRSTSGTSGGLLVTLPPPPPPARHSMNPGMHISTQQHPPGVVRSISVPASVFNSQMSPSTPNKSLPPPPASMPVSPQSPMENPDLDNETNECNVCYERPVNAVLYTCGHMCMCFECAQAVKKEKGALCPICRQEIKDVIKIYRS